MSESDRKNDEERPPEPLVSPWTKRARHAAQHNIKSNHVLGGSIKRQSLESLTNKKKKKARDVEANEEGEKPAAAPSLRSFVERLVPDVHSGTAGASAAVAAAAANPFVNTQGGGIENGAGQRESEGTGADDDELVAAATDGFEAVATLLQHRHNHALVSRRKVAHAIRGLCGATPEPDLEMVRGALPVLAWLVHNSTERDVVENATGALWCFMNDANDAKIQAFVETDGLCRGLVSLLVNASLQTQTYAVLIVGTIVAGTEAQTQHVIDAGALVPVGELLACPKTKAEMRMKACGILSNVMAGNQDQISAVIKGGIVPSLVLVARQCEDLRTREKAALAIGNAMVMAGEDQVRQLMDQGSIQVLCGILPPVTVNEHHFDNRDIDVALRGLENALRVGEQEAAKTGTNEVVERILQADGAEKLAHLHEHHSSSAIRTRAHSILATIQPAAKNAARRHSY